MVRREMSRLSRCTLKIVKTIEVLDFTRFSCIRVSVIRVSAFRVLETRYNIFSGIDIPSIYLHIFHNHNIKWLCMQSVRTHTFDIKMIWEPYLRLNELEKAVSYDDDVCSNFICFPYTRSVYKCVYLCIEYEKFRIRSSRWINQKCSILMVGTDKISKICWHGMTIIIKMKLYFPSLSFSYTSMYSTIYIYMLSIYVYPVPYIYIAYECKTSL